MVNPGSYDPIPGYKQLPRTCCLTCDRTEVVQHSIWNLKEPASLLFPHHQLLVYGVNISHEKTKLLQITKREHTELEVYNPINIDGHQIVFSEVSEHVGVIWSFVMGNLPHIIIGLARTKKH